MGDRAASSLHVRKLVPEDWPAVVRIYEEGIQSGHATFEVDAPTWAEWDEARHPEVRLVAEEEPAGAVVGFAAISPVSRRPAYAGIGEVMLYVAAQARGRGVGTRLLAELVRVSEAASFWTLEAGIFPENTASIRAHLGAGFREVGRRERIGRFHDGRWRDTVLLERRSAIVGTD